MPTFPDFQRVSNPPRPMEYEKYEGLISRKWKKLLSSSTDEDKFQDFLEQHPCLIPRASGPDGRSGHTPFPAAVITKPKLPGIRSQIPDFLWIAMDSDTIYPTLVELESPTKPWFTQRGKQSAKLTDALGQIKDWRIWFSKPHNVTNFIESYRFKHILFRRRICPTFVLIYGRRKEVSKTEELIEKKSQLRRWDEILMTYDRLEPHYGAKNLMTVKITNQGYEAMAIPPTLKLGNELTTYHELIANKDLAARKNPYISKKRKDFLVKKFPYWDQYQRNRPAITKGPDYEE